MKNTSVAIALLDWMEATGTNRRQLAKMSGIGESHLSYILSGARGCSRRKLMRLHEITQIPLKDLMRWLDDNSSRSERTVKASSEKCA